jgi:hypothetical protein
MLCDPHTKQITALFDLDFSLVTHPFHEFYSSFRDVGGNLVRKELRPALISGNFAGPPPEGVDADLWQLARTFDASLAERKAVKPSDIKGVGGLLELSELLRILYPFQFHGLEVAGVSEERRAEMRAEAEGRVVDFLGRHGY